MQIQVEDFPQIEQDQHLPAKTTDAAHEVAINAIQDRRRRLDGPGGYLYHLYHLVYLYAAELFPLFHDDDPLFAGFRHATVSESHPHIENRDDYPAQGQHP
jgi:hypothetical protein